MITIIMIMITIIAIIVIIVIITIMIIPQAHLGSFRPAHPHRERGRGERGRGGEGERERGGEGEQGREGEEGAGRQMGQDGGGARKRTRTAEDLNRSTDRRAPHSAPATSDGRP